MHSTVMGSRHIVMGERCSVVGCVPRNLRGVIGHRSQGIRWALLPGARSRAKASVQAGGACKGDISVPSEVAWATGRLQVEKAAGMGILEGGMNVGGA